MSMSHDVVNTIGSEAVPWSADGSAAGYAAGDEADYAAKTHFFTSKYGS